MEQRVARLKSCLAHIQQQFGHMTSIDMPDDVRTYLGDMWKQVMHMQLELAALERQHATEARAKVEQAMAAPVTLSSTISTHGEGYEGSSRDEAIEAAFEDAPYGTAEPSPVIETPLFPVDIKPESAISHPNQSRVPRHEAGENREILVIDDCQNTQNILSFSLGSEGLNITSLTEPERWVSAVRQVRPQVILLDLMMPGMDGFDVLRQLRATKDFDSIFVVVGSSRSFEHDRLAVLGMGADDFIPKPYHIKELALKFNNLMRSVRRYS